MPIDSDPSMLSPSGRGIADKIQTLRAIGDSTVLCDMLIFGIRLMYDGERVYVSSDDPMMYFESGSFRSGNVASSATGSFEFAIFPEGELGSIVYRFLCIWNREKVDLYGLS